MHPKGIHVRGGRDSFYAAFFRAELIGSDQCADAKPSRINPLVPDGLAQIELVATNLELDSNASGESMPYIFPSG